MINNTKIRIPKKYEYMIEEINHDQEGYWVTLAEGFYSPNSGCHTIHEYTQKEVLEQIRDIQQETYDLRDIDGTYIEENMSFEEAVERYKTTTRGQDMHSRQTGDSVEKLWDVKNLKRDDDILLDEAVEEAYEKHVIEEIEKENRKMLTNMIERKYVERYEYSREFSKKSDPHIGFSFSCDKDGHVFNLDDPYRAENFRTATESGEYIDEGIAERNVSYWEHATGTCECGKKVHLAYFRNTCECGLEYNSLGQELAPREEW